MKAYVCYFHREAVFAPDFQIVRAKSQPELDDAMLKALKHHAPFDMIEIYDEKARAILRYAKAPVPLH